MNPADGTDCKDNLCPGGQTNKCCKPKAACDSNNCKPKSTGCTGTFELDTSKTCADADKVCCKIKGADDDSGEEGVSGGGTTPGASYDLAEYAPIVGDIPTLIGQIIKGFMGIVGSLALLAFIYGGFLMLISQGDSNKVKKGKDTMIWAAAGLIVIFGSYIFVSYIITKLSESGTGDSNINQKAPCPADHPECKNLGTAGYECISPGSNSACSKYCCKPTAN